jgi:hypothetical protein
VPTLRGGLGAARELPVERALARQGVAVAGGDQARRDDCRDPLLAHAEDRPRAWQPPPVAEPGRLPEPPPWKQVFKDLRRLRRLGRPLSFFGWSLAHGALRCGGALADWWAPQLEDAAEDAAAFLAMCGCSAGCCAEGQRPPGEPQPCETLGHVGFVHCPVVRPALSGCAGSASTRWARRRPRTISLASSSTAPRPCGRRRGAARHAPWDLWTHLRLQYCSRSVWTLTTRRNRTEDAFDSAAIVAMRAAVLERAIRHTGCGCRSHRRRCRTCLHGVPWGWLGCSSSLPGVQGALVVGGCPC